MIQMIEISHLIDISENEDIRDRCFDLELPIGSKILHINATGVQTGYLFIVADLGTAKTMERHRFRIYPMIDWAVNEETVGEYVDHFEMMWEQGITYFYLFDKVS